MDGVHLYILRHTFVVAGAYSFHCPQLKSAWKSASKSLLWFLAYSKLLGRRADYVISLTKLYDIFFWWWWWTISHLQIYIYIVWLRLISCRDTKPNFHFVYSFYLFIYLFILLLLLLLLFNFFLWWVSLIGPITKKLIKFWTDW